VPAQPPYTVEEEEEGSGASGGARGAASGAASGGASGGASGVTNGHTNGLSNGPKSTPYPYSTEAEHGNSNCGSQRDPKTVPLRVSHPQRAQ
jgi:hypothetical protein